MIKDLKLPIPVVELVIGGGMPVSSEMGIEVLSEYAKKFNKLDDGPRKTSLTAVFNAVNLYVHLLVKLQAVEQCQNLIASFARTFDKVVDPHTPITTLEHLLDDFRLQFKLAGKLISTSLKN